MALPELPRKNKRLEAQYDSVVADLLAKKHTHRNWAMEAKLVGSRLLPHQKVALKQVENGKFKPYKIRDAGTQNPFDFFHLGDADAIVCYIDPIKKTAKCNVNSGVTVYNFKL